MSDEKIVGVLCEYAHKHCLPVPFDEDTMLDDIAFAREYGATDVIAYMFDMGATDEDELWNLVTGLFNDILGGV